MCPENSSLIKIGLYGFSRNLIFEEFSKMCTENSSLIKIGLYGFS